MVKPGTGLTPTNAAVGLRPRVLRVHGSAQGMGSAHVTLPAEESAGDQGVKAPILDSVSQAQMSLQSSSETVFKDHLWAAPLSSL